MHASSDYVSWQAMACNFFVCSVLLLPEGADLSVHGLGTGTNARGNHSQAPLEDLNCLLRAATPCGATCELAITRQAKLQRGKYKSEICR